MMASALPIIAPTRSATPPPPESYNNAINGLNGLGLDGYLNSPVKSAFNSHTLSPMDENFPIGRYGPSQAYSAHSLQPLSPSDTNSLYGMRSGSSLSSPNPNVIDENKRAFNFQSTTLAKSPITKSVSLTPAKFARVPADLSCLERRPEKRTQIQTQQRLPSDIPRASTPSTSRLTQFIARPDFERMSKEHVAGTKHSILVEHMSYDGGSVYFVERRGVTGPYSTFSPNPL